MGNSRVFVYLSNQKVNFRSIDLHYGRAAQPAGTFVHLHALVVRYIHRVSLATRDSVPDHARACKRNLHANYLLPLRAVHGYCSGDRGERYYWMVVKWLPLLDDSVQHSDLGNGKLEDFVEKIQTMEVEKKSGASY